MYIKKIQSKNHLFFQIVCLNVHRRQNLHHFIPQKTSRRPSCSFVRSICHSTVCVCDDFHNDRSNFTGFGCNETEQRWPPAAVAFRDRLESQQAMTFTPGLNPEQVKPRELYMYHKA